MEDRTQSEPLTKGDLAKFEAEFEPKFSTLDGKVSQLDGKVSQLDGKVSQLDGKVSQLDGKVSRLAIDLAKTQADVREIKETIATKLSTKDDISRVMNAIDAFAAEAVAYRNRDTVRGGKILEHEDKLKNHESRLVLLENQK